MAEKRISDEKPLNLKVPLVSKTKHTKKTTGLKCIIHYPHNTSDCRIRPLSEASFKNIQKAAKIRQLQDSASARLDYICSTVPENYSSHIHGCHRWCYANFTNISKLLKRKNSSTDSDVNTCCSKKRRRSTGDSQNILFPADSCLFCERNRIRKLGTEESLVKCITKTSELSIQRAAERQQDEAILLKIQGVDLVAREAHYHASCRKDYTRAEDRNANRDANITEELNAHKAAFEYIAQYVKESIIEGSNVERMSMIRERYLTFIQKNSPEFHNASYKTSKLKSKLVKHFGSDLQFWQPNYKSELVYSSGVQKGQAVESAFEVAASDKKRLEEAAVVMRRLIKMSHNECQPMPWPPSTEFLQSDTISPPQCLQDFITLLITGKKIQPLSEKQRRLVLSFAQDMCQAVTRGQWIMPKHLLLGMTLRNLTGSAEIVSLINRFGHCAAYSNLLELETAMCKSIDDRVSVLPSTVHPNRNIVTHLCWDNFDMREETPSGSGTTHTSHGIIIQEISAGEDGTSYDGPDSVPRTKDRSVVCKTQDIEPCFAKDKAEPKLTISTTEVSSTQSTPEAELSDMLWICSRDCSQDKQTVPSWSGWVSVTESNLADSEQQSTVDYMAPVFAPITENATVQHILKVSQEASMAVGQRYTIVTFDLAVAKKAYALVWQHPEIFGDIIVRMGGFHLTCSYMGALGKSLRCSGFEEILVESGICASGSIEKVMTGKHYNRALRVHKLVLEALERILLHVFQTSHEDSLDEEGKDTLDRLAKDPCKERLCEALANESCMNMISLFLDFKEKIRQGELGKTAQFWLSYMDKVWLILQFQRATKENNLDLHIATLQKMCALFFSYDHPNYARYTTVYLLTLINLPQSHPGAEELLRQNGFIVNRSDVPASRNAVDITIEQTINRHAKSHAGIVGFSRNHSAYYRWCMTRHARAKYQQATLEMADMDSQEWTSHKDMRPSQIARSEEDTCHVIQAISNFINPFEVDNKDVLYCLSSGAPAPTDIEQDLLQADKVGNESYRTFVQERLIERTKSFNAPIKKQNLKTFANLTKSAKVTSQSKKTKQITAERNVFGQLVLLSLEHDISLERVLSFPLGPVPWALATADGIPVKTDKSKLMHFLEGDSHKVQRPTQDMTTYVIDGNALLQAQMTLPSSFGELAHSLFKQLPDVQRVDFVTDSYLPLSIKGIERARRGSSEAHLIKGVLTKIPRDWKKFLSSEENKRRLTSFLLEEWRKDQYAPQHLGKKLLFVTEKKCICLSSSDGQQTVSEEIEELNSTQEEADTKIILHCLHIAATSPASSTIIVRSPDTDVFVLLLSVTEDIQQKLLFDTGSGNKRRLIDVHSVAKDVGKEMCLVLPAVHAFTGCDTNSAFVRKGKLMPLKILKQHQEFNETFRELGRSADIEEHTFQRLEDFTCLLYGGAGTHDINRLRHEKFVERFSTTSGMLLSSYSGVDMSLLPPCRDSLRMHIKRANYQALIWYHSRHALPCIPGPSGHGWQITEGHLAIKWTENDLMPQELVDVLMEEPEDGDVQEEEEEIPDFVNLTDIIFASDD